MLDDGQVRVLMGPVGSGKSVTCCFEMVRRAGMQPLQSDGVRRSRWAVVRQTIKQLNDTTIRTWLDWFPDGIAGHLKRTPPKNYMLRIGDVELELMFRGLDHPDDVASLNSLELTGAWFNECRDIRPELVDAMRKRVGRYPSKADGGSNWYGIIGDTNPPTMGSWWWAMMEGVDPDNPAVAQPNGWSVYKQPSGLAPDAENLENLPEGYYDTTGLSPDYIRVFVHGQYGRSLGGRPVWEAFRPEWHVAREALSTPTYGSQPVVVGMDLGLTPACVFCGLDARGRMLVFDECAAFSMGLQRFVRTLMKPLISRRFPGRPIMVSVDPAARQRSQNDERSAMDILLREGISAVVAPSNTVTDRVNAVDDFLTRHVDGDPAFLVDPRCVRLKAAMMGGYSYKQGKDDVIDKNRHSHIADALQYAALHINKPVRGGMMGRVRQVERVDSLGWT